MTSPGPSKPFRYWYHSQLHSVPESSTTTSPTPVIHLPSMTATTPISPVSVSTHTRLLNQEWKYSHNRPAAIDALDTYIGVTHLRALDLTRNEARVAALGLRRLVRLVSADYDHGREKEDDREELHVGRYR
jgi:hypothetical protein